MNPRIHSVDALRGLVMFTMILVNDLASAGKVVPDWMMHYELRHPDANGLTFVDLVFPAFLFLVGLSIPPALENRLGRGVPLWKTASHVLLRVLSLLFLGVLMVNETPDADRLGWSPALWRTLLFLCAIFGFGSVRWLRIIGIGGLLWLGTIWVGPHGQRIWSFSPVALNAKWWGILGLIGWDYLVGCIVFLLFRRRPTALLGCMVLLLGLFVAEHSGAFDGSWLGEVVGIGDTLGSQGAITVGGVLFSSLVMETGSRVVETGLRIRLTLWFVSGTVAGALLLLHEYGLNKNSATPSYALFSCATTAALWLAVHSIGEVRRLRYLYRPLECFGHNVLLAYLLSEALPSLLVCIRADGIYEALARGSLVAALTRSLFSTLILMGLTCGLNRIGFRVRL